MTKAKPNIATAPALLKFEAAEPTEGLSIAAAMQELIGVMNEMNRIDKMSSSLIGSNELPAKTLEAHDFYTEERRKALERFIATGIATTAQDAMSQIFVARDCLTLLEIAAEDDDDGPESAWRSGLRRIEMILESVLRHLEEMSGEPSKDWDHWQTPNPIGKGHVPHVRLAETAA